MIDRNETTFVIIFLLLFAIVIGLLSLFVNSYQLPKYQWKCTNASIVDEDPSNTECTVYKRKDLDE